MLSHQILTGLCFNEPIGSSTMNARRMPVGFKLEMDLELLGLSSEMS